LVPPHTTGHERGGGKQAQSLSKVVEPTYFTGSPPQANELMSDCNGECEQLTPPVVQPRPPAGKAGIALRLKGAGKVRSVCIRTRPAHRPTGLQHRPGGRPGHPVALLRPLPPRPRLRHLLPPLQGSALPPPIWDPPSTLRRANPAPTFPFRPDIIPPREAPDDTSPGPPSPPEHTNWFSWALESLASAVYAFGFVLMTPQLYINYKVRWRPRTPPPPPPPLLPPCDWLRRRFCSVLIRSPHGIGPLSRTLAPPLSMGYTGGIQ